MADIPAVIFIDREMTAGQLAAFTEELKREFGRHAPTVFTKDVACVAHDKDVVAWWRFALSLDVMSFLCLLSLARQGINSIVDIGGFVVALVIKQAAAWAVKQDWPTVKLIFRRKTGWM